MSSISFGRPTRAVQSGSRENGAPRSAPGVPISSIPYRYNLPKRRPRQSSLPACTFTTGCSHSNEVGGRFDSVTQLPLICANRLFLPIPHTPENPVTATPKLFSAVFGHSRALKLPSPLQPQKRLLPSNRGSFNVSTDSQTTRGQPRQRTKISRTAHRR